jgi:hypothetical protein
MGYDRGELSELPIVTTMRNFQVFFRFFAFYVFAGLLHFPHVSKRSADSHSPAALHNSERTGAFPRSNNLKETRS